MNETKKINHFNELNRGFQKFYDDVLLADFPHVTAKLSSFWGSEIKEGSRFDSELSLNNLFKDSPYQYTGLDDFLHFTSCQGLSSILRSGFMRASEFRHLADEHELKFGLEKVQPLIDQIEKVDLENLRQTSFTFSMCHFESDILRNQYLWSQYSAQSTGVAIRFKLIRPEHENFAIGSVLYGSKNLSILDGIKIRAESFATSGHLFPNNFIELLAPILAYHKVESYSSEQEVRLLFRHPKHANTKHKDVSIFEEINASNNLRYFKEIPLKEKYRKNIDPSYVISFEEWSKHFVSIEITDIYFGHRIPIPDLIDFAKYFYEIKSKNGFSYKLWRLNQDNVEIPL